MVANPQLWDRKLIRYPMGLPTHIQIATDKKLMITSPKEAARQPINKLVA